LANSKAKAMMITIMRKVKEEDSIMLG